LPRIVVTRVMFQVNGTELAVKRLLTAAVLAALCIANTAAAQTYPARSIQVIVPFAAAARAT
jgi:hypothetical protein